MGTTQSHNTLNMNKLVLLFVFGIACAAATTINNVQDDFSHVQEIDDDGDEVTGTYRWKDGEGNEFFVSYISDEDGYRVLDSNVVPITVGGVRADGAQGASHSFEDSDDHDDSDDDTRERF